MAGSNIIIFVVLKAVQVGQEVVKSISFSTWFLQKGQSILVLSKLLNLVSIRVSILKALPGLFYWNSV